MKNQYNINAIEKCLQEKQARYYQALGENALFPSIDTLQEDVAHIEQAIVLFRTNLVIDRKAMIFSHINTKFILTPNDQEILLPFIEKHFHDLHNLRLAFSTLESIAYGAVTLIRKFTSPLPSSEREPWFIIPRDTQYHIAVVGKEMSEKNEGTITTSSPKLYALEEILQQAAQRKEAIDIFEIAAPHEYSLAGTVIPLAMTKYQRKQFSIKAKKGSISN